MSYIPPNDNSSQIYLFNPNFYYYSSNGNFLTSNNLQDQSYINSNSITDIVSFLISSNILSKQNYINSNSIIDITKFLLSSNILSKQRYINSNSISDIVSFLISSNTISKQNFINSNSIADINSFLISSNVLSKQNYINSNSIQDILNFLISSNTLNNINNNIQNNLNSTLNSNILNNILQFYISSNILSKQYYINSNSITNILGMYDTISARNTALSTYLTTSTASSTYLTLSGGTLTGLLELYSTTQTLPRLIISGQEYYSSGGITTGGIAILLGVNRTTGNNRQLWIGDSTNLTQNTTNGVIRIIPNVSPPTIDAIATDGNTRLNMSIGGSITILANGNIGINNTNPQYKLDVNGTININGILTLLKDNWIKSSDNIDRIYFGNNATTYFHSGIGGTGGFNFRNFAQSDIFTINENGNVVSTGSISCSTITTSSLNIKSSSEADSAILYLATPFSSGSALKCAIIAEGQSTYSRSKLHFCLDNTADNSTTYNASVANSRMSIDYNGGVLLTNSLTFKTDVWNYSSDGNQRLYFGNNGITYYQGYGQYVLDINHEWRNHQGVWKMKLDNSGNLRLAGALQCNFLTIANTNRDLTGIAYENTAVNDVNNAVLYCIQGTFTGFHRVFTDDELFNIEQPQQFKDDYEGRIVISNGKIATDTTDNGVQNNTEWEILYDKAGITVEDALPKIELSRTKKDKRCFGVLGDRRRKNNRPERMIVNSVGEGAVWICNSNGNIENGDYITSSDYLGYGEKQDDDLLHNYTVAKATIDCNFELDSQYYKCLEINDLDINGDKLRVAFISCSYHCG